jgi:ADP-ribosylglycohydrolase
MATEFIKPPRDQAVQDKALQFTSYVKHPTHSLQPGQYSDDTQMAVAVTEVLLGLDYPKVSYHLQAHKFELRLQFANAFVECFKRDPRDGYARSFQAFLGLVVDGNDFLQRIRPTSDKNGACMRAVPIGVISDLDTVEFIAKEQASITHNTEGGKQSALLVALMSHFALYVNEPFSKFQALLCDRLKVSPMRCPLWEKGRVIGPNLGMNTARAVMTLLMTETTLIGITRKAIEWGGDTDSVLAIAWGIASARMHDELPSFFERDLENGPYGRTYLAGLGEKLMQKFYA